ncbi:AAA-like domain-containing protein [Candidatus Entotheonella palauensis]|nr:AAA-like domain-containing protein [Candidatus Entotheonella palauensis]
MVAQIEQGSYFTVYAPRQMGKTTLLRRIASILEDKPDYIPLALSFEAFEGWPVADFLSGFSLDLKRELESRGATSTDSDQSVQQVPDTFFALREFFLDLHRQVTPKRIVLIIDEFDSTPREAIAQLLQLWRQIYLSGTSPRSLHSVVLVGLQNIATLNLGRSSPFNIARQVEVPVFSDDEIRFFFEQYTAESGQGFTEDAITSIQQQTGGHPFLVNRLAVMLTEQLVPDRTQEIARLHVETAVRMLVTERNFNFETLIRRANPHRDVVLNILFGVHEVFNLNDPAIGDLQLHGVIRETPEGACQIANPIYSVVLLAAFRSRQSGLQGAILANGYDVRPHIVGDQLRIDQLLSRFRAFIERRGREAFQVTPTPREATGQYLLMAYLDWLVREIGGDLFTEVDSGNGRLALIVVYRGHRYIVETKVWRGQRGFDAGLEQLQGYLETEGETEGFYVIFHARPNVYGKLPDHQLEYTIQRGRITIHAYLVRLGDMFDATESS